MEGGMRDTEVDNILLHPMTRELRRGRRECVFCREMIYPGETFYDLPKGCAHESCMEEELHYIEGDRECYGCGETIEDDDIAYQENGKFYCMGCLKKMQKEAEEEC